MIKKTISVFIFLFVSVNYTFALQSYDVVDIRNVSVSDNKVLVTVSTPSQEREAGKTSIFVQYGSTSNYGKATNLFLVNSLTATSGIATKIFEITDIPAGEYYFLRGVRKVASTTSSGDEYAISSPRSVIVSASLTVPQIQSITISSGQCPTVCEVSIPQNIPTQRMFARVNTVAQSYLYSSGVNFQIVSGNTDNIFGINGSGEIFVNKSNTLNKDIKDDYELTIKATHSGNQSLFSEKVIKVIITGNADTNTSGTYTPIIGNSSYTDGSVNNFTGVSFHPTIKDTSYTDGSSYYKKTSRPTFVPVISNNNYTNNASNYYTNYQSGNLDISRMTREQAIEAIKIKILELQVMYYQALLEESKR